MRALYNTVICNTLTGSIHVVAILIFSYFSYNIYNTKISPNTITTSMPPPHPNSYTLPPTQHIPSSPLPLLHYASALPSPVTKPTARAFLEANSWLQGGVFKHYPTPHFHSNTHECYAVVAGESTFLLGKGPIDEDVDVEEDREGEREGQSEKKGNWPGVTISVKTGDVVVNPAGVAHSCLESSPDFEYIGVYPEVRHPTTHLVLQTPNA